MYALYSKKSPEALGLGLSGYSSWVLGLDAFNSLGLNQHLAEIPASTDVQRVVPNKTSS